MKIAIVSDTHGNVANFRKIINWLNSQGIETILHCGDIGSPESLKESLIDFKGEFFGVFGNMDRDFKILIKEYNEIPNVKINEEILETEIVSPCEISRSEKKIKIAITHFPEKAKKLAESGKYNLVFYGHTHKPWVASITTRKVVSGKKKTKECLFINPGESAGQLYKPCFAVFDTATNNLELKILEKL